jgi:hypothetical protein
MLRAVKLAAGLIVLGIALCALGCSPASVPPPPSAGGAAGDDQPTAGTGGAAGAAGSEGPPAQGGTGGAGPARDAGGAQSDADGGGGRPIGGAGGDDRGAPDGGPADAGRDASVPPPPPPSNGVFRHPGVLVNRAQLDFIRDKVKAGEEPWTSAFAKTSANASLTAAPMPVADVICGPYSTPNVGCTEELHDSTAAWSDALAWYITGDEAYARKTIELMNAWSGTIKSHSDHNAPLQAGWCASLWPRAGELIRYTYGGWTAADIAKFSAMLKNVYLPIIVNGNGGNGNWELTMIDATMDIAVFLDDKATFDKAVSMWHKRVPAYLYLKADGPTPVPPPGGTKSIVSFWQGQSTFVDGLAQETCRDLLHTQLGMSSAINAAETAFQQGVDLYGAESTRLRAGLEFHASYDLGAPVPSWLCGGKLNLRVLPMWEIAYNHFKNRLGIDLPQTLQLITTQVRSSNGLYKQMAWETLTHAGVGTTGLK